MTERIKTEHEEQREFVSWFRQTYRSVRIFAIPNGGMRNKATACRLKAEGVSSGVPDLLIPEWSTFVEMKRASGGVISASQSDWHEHLDDIGYRVVVCNGAEHAKEIVMRDWNANEYSTEQ